MTQRSWTKMAIAVSTFAGAALFSFGSSAHHGISLSVDGAQARVGRPLTPVSVAGVARRQARRGAYGTGVVGAGLAGAAAVGTAAAVAATSPWGWGGYYGGGPYVGTGPYVGSGVLAARASYGGPIETHPYYIPRAYFANGPWYGYSGWDDYKTRNGLACTPGELFKGDDGLMHVCQ